MPDPTIRRALEETLHHDVRGIDPHDDESWLVDALLPLVERFTERLAAMQVRLSPVTASRESVPDPTIPEDAVEAVAVIFAGDDWSEWLTDYQKAPYRNVARLVFAAARPAILRDFINGLTDEQVDDLIAVYVASAYPDMARAATRAALRQIAEADIPTHTGGEGCRQ